MAEEEILWQAFVDLQAIHPGHCCIRYPCVQSRERKESAILLINFALAYCASIDVISLLSNAIYCDCKNTQIVLSLKRVNDFLSVARKEKLS